MNSVVFAWHLLLSGEDRNGQFVYGNTGCHVTRSEYGKRQDPQRNAEQRLAELHAVDHGFDSRKYWSRYRRGEQETDKQSRVPDS